MSTTVHETRVLLYHTADVLNPRQQVLGGREIITVFIK